MVCASEKGEMRWIDLRGGPGGPGGGAAVAVAGEEGAAAGGAGEGAATTVRVSQAHTKGGVCALAGHRLAPLLATGTTSQV